MANRHLSRSIAMQSLFEWDFNKFDKSKIGEILKRNIEEFIITKKELNNKTPRVIIQTLLTSFSENEVEDIIRWAQNIGADAINLKTLSMGSHTSEEMKRKYNYLCYHVLKHGNMKL